VNHKKWGKYRKSYGKKVESEWVGKEGKCVCRHGEKKKKFTPGLDQVSV